MKLNEADNFSAAELSDLYRSVQWLAYADRSKELAEAVTRSTYVVSARDGERLVGMARCLSDDWSIFYLQDVLVHPEYQNQGLGKKLLDQCLHRFAHVRQKVLLTDDEEYQHRMYKSAGYQDVATLREAPLHAFVRIEGMVLR
jgi:ribosomal protein S18 acetylase RimI-like enzyme